jgi:hypothetical protein
LQVIIFSTAVAVLLIDENMRRLILTITTFIFLIACSKPKTIFIDSKIQSQQKLDQLDSSEIFSITTWAPGEAPEFYQKWNKNIVISVKTKIVEEKLQVERYNILNRILDSSKNGSDVLLVCNGLLVPLNSQTRLRKLLPNQLSNAQIVELEEAKKIYGSMARSITLYINTYDLKYNYNQ